MINISGKHIDSAVQIHYEACSPIIEKKLNLIIDVFEVWINSKQIKKTYSLQKYYGLHHNTIKTLINPLLNGKKRKRGKKYNISSNECESLLFSCQKNVLNKKITLDERKRCFKFFNQVKLDLKEILTSSPKLLSDKFITPLFYRDQTDPLIKKIIENIFSYEMLTGEGYKHPSRITNWTSYEFTLSTKILVCPYCNKNWINTVFDDQGEKITNPQLDHFFCKSEFPILRLSFYNLIPSCETCNVRIKKEAIFTYSDYLNPYVNGFENFSKFIARPKDTASSEGVGNNYEIVLRNSLDKRDAQLVNKNINNYKFFKIKEIYECHGDLISEIFFLKQKHGSRFLSTILRGDKFINMKIEEIYRMVFSNYYHEEDFNRRPFAKLIRDIVDDQMLI